ncbi:unnamed protein product [Leptidea sinapis]|uniref:Lipid-binding serum glycoprotein N-terminal domain-containing protein n=1 Tax=Leptidea sinapis TaxID=189913 RepID=A0A5E4QJ21_9NEOP|nr:unnamed protein product [Leptidea sinapis]
MRFIVIFALAVFSIASGVPVTTKHVEEILMTSSHDLRNRFLGDILRNVLEAVRDIMKNGSGSIPVLDPLQIESLRVDEDLIGIPGVYISLGMNVENLSTFVVDTMDVHLESLLAQRYRIEFEGYIPEVNANANRYSMDVNINNMAIKGNGGMKLKVTQPKLKGTLVVSLSMNNGIYLTIRDCTLAFSLDTFEPEITGLFENAVSSQLVSSFLKSLVPELMVAYENDINQFLSEAVLTYGNMFLQDFDLGSLLNP